jgi:hypothetical protein
MPVLKTTTRFYLLVTLMTAAFILTAQTPSSRAYQVKAAFLFNFSQFVDWPSDAFTDTEAPMVIGILGEDPFGTYLEEIVSNERINGHPLTISHFQDINDIKNCHILFVNVKRTDQLSEILTKLKQRNILTVSDSPSFIKDGGMIRFMTEDNKIRLQINPQAARSAELNISSKLLKLADIVTLKN